MWQGLCSVQTWIYSAIMAIGVIGLAKSWTRFKNKYAEKMAGKETTENKE